MPVGTSGVSGTQSSVFGAADRVLDLVRNAEMYQKRMAELEAATAAADAAKRDAKTIVAKAREDAEAEAAKIRADAEEQAQGRLDAVRDLEADFASRKAAWEASKAEEEAKLRSDRAKAAASTKASTAAKEKAEAERASYEEGKALMESTRQNLLTNWNAIQEIAGKAL